LSGRRFIVLSRLSVAAMVALWAVELYLNRTLASPEAPGGIVSLELACTEDKAGCILDEWDAADPKIRENARQGIGWDFPFILFYVTTLALGCIQSGKDLATSWGWPVFKRVGWIFVVLALIAGFVTLSRTLDCSNN
jgi:hypothetical protein